MQVIVNSYWHQKGNLLYAQEPKSWTEAVMWCLHILIHIYVLSLPLLWKGALSEKISASAVKQISKLCLSGTRFE